MGVNIIWSNSKGSAHDSQCSVATFHRIISPVFVPVGTHPYMVMLVTLPGVLSPLGDDLYLVIIFGGGANLDEPVGVVEDVVFFACPR